MDILVGERRGLGDVDSTGGRPSSQRHSNITLKNQYQGECARVHMCSLFVCVGLEKKKKKQNNTKKTDEQTTLHP